MSLSMNRWKGKVAIVTGASAGIGAAIATKLVESGVIVVGLARGKEKLDEFAKTLENKNGKFYSFKTDVSKEQDILDAFRWVKESLGPVHILINNAGLRRKTNLIDGNTNMWKEIMDTNVLGLCIATREAIKDMRANKVDGHIVHMNSVGGHKIVKIPYLSVYPASKHAVTALTETLRQELNSINSKIKITSVSPGLVQTEFRLAAGVLEERKDNVFENLPSIEAVDVAEAVMYVLSTPPHVQVHELTIKPVGEHF
ncbi:hypothetical protein ILUMI_04848 [Ignelater luminosus]|uniref:Farnesol dehydrogenase n=1 Tax=Ignelater luminosus TaxID=2038154 RepID=A0A8K0DE19_IGNLU|nr:hypothetical protein ILUMI_04848 [Ignelater luminosus]